MVESADVDFALAAVSLVVGGPQRGVGGVGPVRAQHMLQVDGGFALGGADRGQPPDRTVGRLSGACATAPPAPSPTESVPGGFASS